MDVYQTRLKGILFMVRIGNFPFVSSGRFSPCEHREVLVGEYEQRPGFLLQWYTFTQFAIRFAMLGSHNYFLNFFNTCSGVFLGLGLSGIIPTMHFTIAEGFVKATTVGQMGWFILMGAMYITGAGLYAARIPERYFPGKCDIWVRHYFKDRLLVFMFMMS